MKEEENEDYIISQSVDSRSAEFNKRNSVKNNKIKCNKRDKRNTVMTRNVRLSSEDNGLRKSSQSQFSFQRFQIINQQPNNCTEVTTIRNHVQNIQNGFMFIND